MTQLDARSRSWSAGDVLLLSAVVLLSLLLLFVGGLAAVIGITSAVSAQQRLGTDVALERLAEGDCVDDYSRVGDALGTYTLIDCARPHAAQLVYIAEFGDDVDGYLGQQASSDLAGSVCAAALRYRLNLVDEVGELPSAALAGIYQSRSNWATGSTQFYCFLVNEDGSPLVGGYFRDDDLG